MFSKRIKAIASLIEVNSVVVDVGTDHALLPIYLYQQNISKNIVASDISNNALEFAKRNIKKSNYKIKTIVSDGLTNIKTEFDTLVITGMGFHTIKKIINDNPSKLPDTIILQANSDHYLLRIYMQDMGYKIKKEIVVKERNIYYVIIKYIKGDYKLSKRYLLYGLSGNYEYLEFLLKRNKDIIKKVPLKKKLSLYLNNYYLKKLLKEYRV